ncbi:hypothetical protein QYF36_020773 [Acer negundo]|nr:hypothetical protein QYF36_020773 [Acer negundo]
MIRKSSKDISGRTGGSGSFKDSVAKSQGLSKQIILKDSVSEDVGHDGFEANIDFEVGLEKLGIEVDIELDQPISLIITDTGISTGLMGASNSYNTVGYKVGK